MGEENQIEQREKRIKFLNIYFFGEKRDSQKNITKGKETFFRREEKKRREKKIERKKERKKERIQKIAKQRPKAFFFSESGSRRTLFVLLRFVL